MNVSRRIATTFVCQTVFPFGLVLFGLVSASHGQTKVALIDIGSVFNSHPRFSAELAELKNSADQFKAEAEQLQRQLMQKAEGMNLFEKESDEYRDAEASLAQESATMEVDQRAKMRELLKQEAQLHFDTYVEVSNAVSQHCLEYGIQLVLRFSREEMDPKNPRTIMQAVNGGVVFNTPTSDITDAIIQRVAAGGRQAAQPDGINR